MKIGGLDVSFEENKAENGEILIRAIVRRVSDGYTCEAYGKTEASALTRASLVMMNRELQEFNRDEHERMAADKKDYSKPSSEEYKAKRKSPMALIETDLLMDVNLFYSQMSIMSKNLSRIIIDFAPNDGIIRNRERVIPFMAEPIVTKEDVKGNGKGRK